MSPRYTVSALVLMVLVAAPARAQDGLLAAARARAAVTAAEQAGVTHVHPRSRVRTLGGVALIVAGAWTAFSYYDMEPTKSCGVSGMASNTRQRESDPAFWNRRYVYYPDRYEFTEVMVDGTCKLEVNVHHGDYELYADGRLVLRAVPYSLPFSTTVERYRFGNSPAGYPYRGWTWIGGEGVVEAATTYGSVPKTRLYYGIAMIGAGALLATLWADAPAPLTDLRVGLTPDGGFLASRSVGF